MTTKKSGDITKPVTDKNSTLGGVEPAPSERCAECYSAVPGEHRKGCTRPDYDVTAPSPPESPAPRGVLTREEYARDAARLADGDWPDRIAAHVRLLAHDASLRERIEELEKQLRELRARTE